MLAELESRKRGDALSKPPMPPSDPPPVMPETLFCEAGGDQGSACGLSERPAPLNLRGRASGRTDLEHELHHGLRTC